MSTLRPGSGSMAENVADFMFGASPDYRKAAGFPSPTPQVIHMPTIRTGDGGYAAANLARVGVLSRGRQSTILTSGGGVDDETKIKRKTLLGE